MLLAPTAPSRFHSFFRFPLVALTAVALLAGAAFGPAVDDAGARTSRDVHNQRTVCNQIRAQADAAQAAGDLETWDALFIQYVQTGCGVWGS